MQLNRFLGCWILALTTSAFAQDAKQDTALHWPRWRGPLETGEAPAANPPIEFSLEKNLVWSTPIPGRGHATPIVIGDRLYVLTAVPLPVPEGEKVEEPAPEPEPREGRGGRGGRGGRRPRGPIAEQEFRVLALDRTTGEVVWNTLVRQAKPHESTHNTGTYASASPVTDGKHLFVSFGSFGAHCLDLAGKVIWSRDFGAMQMRREFGEGASPGLHDGVFIVPHDHEGESFVVALKAENGEELWRKARKEASNWTTPLIREVDGAAQVIIAGNVRSIAYDLKTGEEIWFTTGMTQSVVPAPVYLDGVVYLISGFQGAALQAVALADAKGDATQTEAMRWSYAKGTPYVPSPLLVNGRLYFFSNNNGIFTCLDAKTGDVNFAQERLSGISSVYASPLAASGRIYLASREGNVVVLKEGAKLEVLAENEIGDAFDASPIAVGPHLYLRGQSKLYCFAEKGAH